MLVYVVGLAILSILVTAFTLYCVVVIVRSHALHKPSHTAICSLLCAHLIQGVIVIPSYALKRSRAEPRGLFCDIFRFSYMLTNYASCLSLLLVTVDRFLTIKLPLHYRVKMTSKRMMTAIAAVWVYAGILCSLPFVPREGKKCSYNPRRLWSILMLICNTLVPFIILLALYAEIFKKARLVLEAKKKQRCLKKHSRLSKSNRIFVIVFCYILCWGPSCVYYLVLSLCPKDCFTEGYFDSTAEQWITFIMKLLTFVDGIVAPVIYCYGNRGFASASRNTRRRMTLLMTSTSLQNSPKQQQQQNLLQQLSTVTQSDSNTPGMI